MDTRAHLLSLGWAGPGHSLDSRPHKGKQGLSYDPRHAQNNGIGLVKPLLVSQKKNTFGIGKKAHEPAAGNEWWLKGFEAALGNVGRSDSKGTSGTVTPLDTDGYRGKPAGLYQFFVKGGEIEGTIGKEFAKAKGLEKRKKRKSDTVEGGSDQLAESDRSEKPAFQQKMPKKRKSQDLTQDFETVGAFLEVRDRSEKRQKRGEKAGAFEEFQQAEQFFEARSARRKKSEQKSTSNPDLPVGESPLTKAEYSEQESRRRVKGRSAAKKAAKKTAADPSLREIPDEEYTTNSNSIINSAALTVAEFGLPAVAQAARQTEKGRRNGFVR